VKWFKRHLNWTVVLSLPVGFAFCIVLSYTLGAVYLNPLVDGLEQATKDLNYWEVYVDTNGLFIGTQEEYYAYQSDWGVYSSIATRYNQQADSVEVQYAWIAYPLVEVWILLVGGWSLKQKGRSLWNLLILHCTPIGFLVFLGLSNHSTVGVDRPVEGAVENKGGSQ